MEKQWKQNTELSGSYKFKLKTSKKNGCEDLLEDIKIFLGETEIPQVT